MIAISGLSICRGKRMIISDLSLTLRAGEVTVLIGPNGSGKSTLLSAVSGALPYRGSVRIGGNEVAQTPPETLADHRALMSQHSDLALAFRVCDVVGMGARGALAVERRSLARRIAKLLAEVGLGGLDNRNALALSGGEAQRMHLARALLQAESAPASPFWLMLDEPVANLDLAHQMAVVDRARAFARAGGGAIIVLHDLNLAVRGADRIIVLHKGACVADGSPREVLTDALIEQVYDCRLRINLAPTAAPFLLVQTGT